MKYQILFGSLGALAITLPSYAGPNICWIDKVVIEGKGVRVLFSPSGYNITGEIGANSRFVIGHNDITWLVGPKESRSEPGLLLRDKQSALLIQGVEDSCAIAFATMDGHIGITAHASFSLPGAPARDKTVFIPGESPGSNK